MNWELLCPLCNTPCLSPRSPNADATGKALRGLYTCPNASCRRNVGGLKAWHFQDSVTPVTAGTAQQQQALAHETKYAITACRTCQKLLGMINNTRPVMCACVAPNEDRTRNIAIVRYAVVPTLVGPASVALPGIATQTIRHTHVRNTVVLPNPRNGDFRELPFII